MAQGLLDNQNHQKIGIKPKIKTNSNIKNTQSFNIEITLLFQGQIEQLAEPRLVSTSSCHQHLDPEC